jgi:hypothetical protein
VAHAPLDAFRAKIVQNDTDVTACRLEITTL